MNLAQMLVNYNKPEVSERTLMALRRSTRLPHKQSMLRATWTKRGWRFLFLGPGWEPGREKRGLSGTGVDTYRKRPSRPGRDSTQLGADEGQ